MRIKIHPHVLGHGLTPEQIVSAYNSGSSASVVRYRDRDSEPIPRALIGFDNEMRRIQILFVWDGADSVLVFHAQYLTKQFLAEVKKAYEQLR